MQQPIRCQPPVLHPVLAAAHMKFASEPVVPTNPTLQLHFQPNKTEAAS